MITQNMLFYFHQLHEMNKTPEWFYDSEIYKQIVRDDSEYDAYDLCEGHGGYGEERDCICCCQLPYYTVLYSTPFTEKETI